MNDYPFVQADRNPQADQLANEMGIMQAEFEMVIKAQEAEIIRLELECQAITKKLVAERETFIRVLTRLVEER